MTGRHPVADQISLSSCGQTWGSGGLVVSMWHGDRLELPDKTSQVQN